MPTHHPPLGKLVFSLTNNVHIYKFSIFNNLYIVVINNVSKSQTLLAWLKETMNLPHATPAQLCYTECKCQKYLAALNIIYV